MRGCDKFRREVLAEPRRLGWSARMHWAMCRTCGRFLGEVRVFDGVIHAALAIKAPPEEVTRSPGEPPRPPSNQD